MTTSEIEAKYQASLATVRAEREWLRANGYAESPEGFGRNNGCKFHPKQGKIYVYKRGGYYTCFQCVIAEYNQSRPVAS